MTKHFCIRVLSASMFCLSSLSIAQPASFNHTVDNLPVFKMKSVDNKSLLAAADRLEVQKSQSDVNRPFQIASTLLTHIEEQPWEFVPNAQGGMPTAVMRYKVVSEGATNLNLGFSEFFMPEGAEMYLYTADGEEVLGPYGSDQNEAHGQFWSPLLAGDEVIVEVNAPIAVMNQVNLTLEQVNHGFRGDKPSSSLDFIIQSGSCNVDTACSAGDGWEDQINSVAHYSFSTGSGSFICTGAAINNTSRNNRRLFLTADHCLDQPSYASTVVLYWKFESPSCRAPGSPASGGNGNGRRDLNQSGANMLVQYSDSDFALIELDDPFPAGANVYLAGWNRSSSAPSSATSIHHPAGDEKRISHDFDRLNQSSTHWRVEDWDVGTTEGGSSGSPLFGPDKRIVGQLTGGLAACGNDEYDIYGRMDVNWANGIARYLDPAGTGVSTLDGQYAGTDGPAPDPVDTVTIDLVENLSLNQGQGANYSFTVPAGADNLVVSMQSEGGSGDADLYVSFNQQPTRGTFDCRSWSSSNTESCSFSAPQAGTYEVLVYGYRASTRLAVTAAYEQ